MIEAVSTATTDLPYALALAATEGLGPVGMLRLSNAFGSAAAAWQAPPEEWSAVGVAGRAGKRLGPESDFVCRRLDEIERAGCWVKTVFDRSYPALLRTIYDPPPLLFGRGDPLALRESPVAVVGSRRATPYGVEHAQRMASGLSRAGIVVVSGLAVGIDAIAHRAAIESNGTTVAVLGSGVRRVYPTRHRDLAEQVVQNGAIVSEVPPFEPPDRTYFPRRNRIISGLSAAVVILEARPESGSLITGREALEQGREVFVVPGPAGGPNYGGHRFLADGASFAEGPEDILAFLGKQVSAAPSNEAPRQEPAVPVQWRPVWDALGTETRHVDDLILNTGLRSGELLGILLQMELHGLVRQQPGKNFVRAT